MLFKSQQKAVSHFSSIFGIAIMAVWMVLLSSGWDQLSQGTSHSCPNTRLEGCSLEAGGQNNAIQQEKKNPIRTVP